MVRRRPATDPVRLVANHNRVDSLSSVFREQRTQKVYVPIKYHKRIIEIDFVKGNNIGNERVSACYIPAGKMSIKLDV